MRAREFLKEAGLTQSELAKHGGKYLNILLQLVGDAGTNPIEISPEYREKYGNTAQLAAQTIQALKNTQTANAPLPSAPFFLIPDPQTGQLKDTKGAWGALYKSSKFTALAGRKEYNAGHLNELITGFSVTRKFLAVDKPITSDEVLDLMKQATTSVHQKDGMKSTSIKFDISTKVKYDSAKEDDLYFVGVVPSMSAESFIKFLSTGSLPGDLNSLLSSSVKFVNEAQSVKDAIETVKSDPNNNRIDVTSDGTSDAKSTKADLKLLIDGSEKVLLSLKTSSTDTIGQISGLNFNNLKTFFEKGFNLDISGYSNWFDSTLSKEEVTQNVFRLYDTIFTSIEKQLQNHSPGAETAIVKQLASAANFFARGEKSENVDVVKLDDSIGQGNYKILRFSDNLYDAMKALTLRAKILGKGQGRTIQILVQPDPAVVELKGSDKLCQFRSQVMGGYLRNYFEIGPMMIKLTEIG